MPKKKGYTKAQKAAYAKRMAKKKKQPKKTVVRQNQFRTEYKDRISPVSTYAISTNTGSGIADLPLDSEVLFPYALFNYFQQGSQNGEIDGNQLNARYLNMKVELDFSDLPVIVRTQDGTIPAIDQNYDIRIRQCLILQDLSQYLDRSYLNVRSGRTQPAFNGLTGNLADPTPLELLKTVANTELNKQKYKANFLSYERRQESKVRVLKTIRVKGNLNHRMGTENMVATKVETTTNPDEHTIRTRPYPTPNQYFTFNWKMPRNKVQLQPVIGTTSGDPPVTELAGYWPGKMWIPCVMVSCHRDVADFDLSAHPLRIKQISHFTYTDN